MLTVIVNTCHLIDNVKLNINHTKPNKKKKLLNCEI